MSLHSYSRCWLHLIWGTLEHKKILTKEAEPKVTKFLYDYAKEKNIYMKINFVNAEHVHALIDLPTNFSIEEVMQLFKGSSSNWINKSDLMKLKFAWGRGYGAFSVSHSNLEKVCKYISNQESHHKVKTFQEEYDDFIKNYGLQINR